LQLYPYTILFAFKTKWECLLRGTVSVLNIRQANFSSLDRAMAKTLSLRPLSAEAWVRSQISPYKICSRRSGTSTGSCPSASFSPVSNFPPILYTRHHLHVALASRKADKVWKFSKNSPWEMGEHRAENCFLTFMASSQHCEKRLLASSCLSVCPRGTTWSRERASMLGST